MPKRKRNHQNQPKRKKGKRKARTCWVQECPHLLPPPDAIDPNSLTIRISVAALHDGYQNLHAPVAQTVPIQPSLAHRLPQPLSNESAVAIYTERLSHTPLPPTPPPLQYPNDDSTTCPQKNVHPKYWSQRYRYFPKFDDGIRMTDAAWYSVTPAVLAQHMARRLLDSTATISEKEEEEVQRATYIMDACCGVGGNTIALAQEHPQATIIAVDIDRTSLECLAHNAVTIYGIPVERLVLVQADVVQVLQCYENGQLRAKGGRHSAEPTHARLPTNDHDAVASSSQRLPTIHTMTTTAEYSSCLPATLDAVFLSPPWGGMDYSHQRHFTLDAIALEGAERTLLQSAVTACPAHLAYYLPRNTNGFSLGTDIQRHCQLAGSVELEQLYVHHKLKAVVLYVHTEVKDDASTVATAVKEKGKAADKWYTGGCCIS